MLIVQKYYPLLALLFVIHSLNAQDTIAVKKLISLNSSNFIYTKIPTTKDSTTIPIPKHIQGFFCNFEDQLHRKKVPLNFSLGNSKY